jgi:hypothetical protein
MIQDKVIAEFYLEQERAKQPGYVSRYDDYDYDDYAPAKSHSSRPNPPHYSKPHDSSQRFSSGGRDGYGRTPHQKNYHSKPFANENLSPVSTAHAEAHGKSAPTQGSLPAALDSLPAALGERTVSHEATAQHEKTAPHEKHDEADFGAGIF